MTAQRILYLAPDLIDSTGGVARHGRTVCRALADAGASVTIVALHDRLSASVPAAEMFPSISYLPSAGNRMVFIRRALAAVSRKPGLILVEHPNFSPLGILAARMSGARLVAFGHGIDVWGRLSTPRRLALQRADGIICVSQFTAKQAVKSNGLALNRTSVLHHCLDPDFRVAVASTRQDAPLSLLTVARMSASERYKGHAEVIRVLPALLYQFPDLIYNVVGDGDGRLALETLALDQRVAHAVRFHGAVSEATLATHYANADVFVMPSRGEGFGLVFLEAMAHAKPVVAGNVDATPEVVRHGETGLLVNPADGAALTEAIGRLLADANLRRTMGQRGAEVVASEFSFPIFQGRLLDRLREISVRGDHVAVAHG